MTKEIDYESLIEIANLVSETYPMVKTYNEIKSRWEKFKIEGSLIEYAKPQLSGYNSEVLMLLAKFEDLQNESMEKAFKENKKSLENIGFSGLRIGLERIFSTIFPNENLKDKLKEYRKNFGFKDSFYSIK